MNDNAESRTQNSKLVDHWAVLLGFTVLTVAMTWPVAALFGRGINAFGDVVLQMTALTWNAHALTTNPP